MNKSTNDFKFGILVFIISCSRVSNFMSFQDILNDYVKFLEQKLFS